MGKKQKDETPNINATANRDIIQRLNFLYQASIYLQSLDVRNPETEREEDVEKGETSQADAQNADKKRKRKKTRTRKVTRRRTSDLARDYIRSMRQVAQKTTVKIDPSLKRSLCYGCNSVLVPGISVSIRVKDSARHTMSHMQYTCLNCKATRRIPLFTEDDDTLDGPAQEANDPAADEESPQQDSEQKSVGRPLPLFARPDAGHVIFRGNDQISLDEAGFVPFV